MSAINAIQVRAWRSNVGVIAPDPKAGVYAFRFYPQWVRKGIDLAPFTMPIAQGDRSWRFPGLDEECFKKMPGLLSDALPDAFGNSLIDAWMAGQGVKKEAITELDRLAYMGRRSMGALEFLPAFAPTDDDGEVPIKIKNLVEEARLAVSGSFSDEAAAANTLRHIISVGTSAGGQRPKAVIAWNEQTGEIRSGQFDVPQGFDHWLLKFDGMGKDAALGTSADYGRIEYAYYLMAQSAGLNMSRCRLLEEGGRAHFMTLRWDRDGNNKHHVQTLCSLDHLSYKMKATHGYEQYLLAVQNLLKGDDKAMQEAFRRMAFNVAARNQDDHTKNFSFILPQAGRWQLSPAYDVAHAYNPNNQWTRQHLMSVNGKFDGITREDLVKVGERFKILDAGKILSEVDTAIQGWDEFAKQAGLGVTRIDEIAGHHVRIGAPARGLKVHEQATDSEETQPLPEPRVASAKSKARAH
jgi:serine/threonine-protein kinase HipA